jgi:hypothetical protein
LVAFKTSSSAEIWKAEISCQIEKSSLLMDP